LERLGFIGLGNLGEALARRLLAQGHPLTVFDADPARTVGGAQVAASAGAVADRAAVVFACLPSREASLAVAVEVADGAAFEVLVETSTLGPAAMAEISGFLPVVDCPVSGGPAGADAGTLAAIVSAEPALLERALPALRSLTEHRFVVGDRPGAAQMAKLVNNAIALTGMVTACEAVVMGVKAGLDPAGLLAAVNASSGRNLTTLGTLPEQVLPRTFEGGGPLRLAVKDLGLVVAEARALGTPVRTVERALEVWREAAEALGEDADYTRVIEPMERAAGTRVAGA
jgi:3-hydroxyisobutyrate dehydrogenase-like beta-hydroxyacid dehydrogenase